eukprot:1152374-Pelagomonas_calceolata.AAC.3
MADTGGAAAAFLGAGAREAGGVRAEMVVGILGFGKGKGGMKEMPVRWNGCAAGERAPGKGLAVVEGGGRGCAVLPIPRIACMWGGRLWGNKLEHATLGSVAVAAVGALPPPPPAVPNWEASKMLLAAVMSSPAPPLPKLLFAAAPAENTPQGPRIPSLCNPPCSPSLLTPPLPLPPLPPMRPAPAPGPTTAPGAAAAAALGAPWEMWLMLGPTPCTEREGVLSPPKPWMEVGGWGWAEWGWMEWGWVGAAEPTALTDP